MNHIILARHTHNIITGNEGTKPSDGDITELGKSQALEMKEFLKSYELDCIFTSLFLRSINTSNIINSDRNIKTINTNAFNEYMLRNDGVGVESVAMAKARTMSKIYSIYDIFNSILIVAHSSINQTIYQSLTNCSYNESTKLFKSFGEIRVLRYDHTLGDDSWREVDMFIPSKE